MSKLSNDVIFSRAVLHDLGLISEIELQAISGVSLECLAVWRAKGSGFAYVKIGNNYFYPAENAKAYLEDRTSREIPKRKNDMEKYPSNKFAYTIDEIMIILRVSRPTIYKCLNDGDLKSKKVGGRRLIVHAELVRFLEAE